MFQTVSILKSIKKNVIHGRREKNEKACNIISKVGLFGGIGIGAFVFIIALVSSSQTYYGRGTLIGAGFLSMLLYAAAGAISYVVFQSLAELLDRAERIDYRTHRIEESLDELKKQNGAAANPVTTTNFGVNTNSPVKMTAPGNVQPHYSAAGENFSTNTTASGNMQSSYTYQQNPAYDDSEERVVPNDNGSQRICPKCGMY